MKEDIQVFLNIMNESWRRVSAFISKNSWIEVHTTINDAPSPKVNRFRIGDKAVYDSYNLIYVGTITAITEKTITIKEDYQDGRTHRLKLQVFLRKNYDFDLEEIRRRNAETSMHI